jgi:organic radical activating enzyme
LKSLPELPFLETMITQVCNLSCQGCTNFSDLKHSGYVTWDQGQSWLESWLDRVTILDFGIMGGEPMINPEWKKWITGVRSLLPLAQIRFTTNGLLLSKHTDLIDFLEDVGNVVFKISVHVNTAELEQHIAHIQQCRPWQPVTEFGINRWRTGNNLRFQINRPEWFYKTFQGNYNNMQPHNSDPALAFAACVQQTCPLLHNGRLYKCSTSALTPEILDRYVPVDSAQWEPYHDPGIDPDCSARQLTDFLDNFGKPHTMCGQCPTHLNWSSKLHHPSTVTIK